ncbi:MAG: adenosine-specific kinase [Candidatus Micrarchaeota archaeon]
MELKAERITIPEGCNVILGQTHFIKSADDLYECIAEQAPSAKFGVAFSEASGKRLVRIEGNDDEMKKGATKIALQLACGHVFVVLMREAFPISVLNALKETAEVCSVFCATANPLEAIVAETENGRGIMGVIDGATPLGVETETDRRERKELLKRFGYKS